MTPDELLAHCRQQQQLNPGGVAEIGLVLPGRYGRGQKRLCPGGPVGRVAHEQAGGTVLVYFRAQEVIDFIEQASK